MKGIRIAPDIGPGARAFCRRQLAEFKSSIQLFSTHAFVPPISGNSGEVGGGAYRGTLNNCKLRGNGAILTVVRPVAAFLTIAFSSAMELRLMATLVVPSVITQFVRTALVVAQKTPLPVPGDGTCSFCCSFLHVEGPGDFLRQPCKLGSQRGVQQFDLCPDLLLKRS